MAKLRKMLGSPEDPSIKGLMGLIETQSKRTLALWAVQYVREQYLPLCASLPEGARMEQIAAEVEHCLEQNSSFTQLKPILKEARELAKAVEDPAAQAACRAAATAYAVFQTPTNALGFAFYGAAARAYAKAGVHGSPEQYDLLAQEEFEKILSSLQAAAVPDEPNPVKVNWNC